MEEKSTVTMTVFDQKIKTKKKILKIFSFFFYEKNTHIYLKPFLRDIIISILLPYVLLNHYNAIISIPKVGAYLCQFLFLEQMLVFLRMLKIMYNVYFRTKLP